MNFLHVLGKEGVELALHSYSGIGYFVVHVHKFTADHILGSQTLVAVDHNYVAADDHNYGVAEHKIVAENSDIGSADSLHEWIAVRSQHFGNGDFREFEVPGIQNFLPHTYYHSQCLFSYG